MPTPDFDYARAGSVDEALALLTNNDNAQFLAGGHSLLPIMKQRLASPGLLIDISELSDLHGIEEAGGQLHIGALTTHRTVERSSRVQEKCPVVAEAASGIGDPQVRNRGTMGGSLAHADPAADYPALVLALDAEIEATRRTGTRTIAADEFFRDMFETALNEDEMITQVRVPVLTRGMGAAYAKFENPASRYAIVGVAALVRMEGGVCESARVGVTGAAPVAFRATNVEQKLAGQRLDERAIDDAVKNMVDPGDLISELSGSAEYRAHLCEVMAKEALTKAVERAR